MDDLLQSNRTLDRIVSSIGDLPASPAIVSSLMTLTADVNTSIDRICQTIMVDQSLAARVLKLSNSSFYGRTKEVRTLKEAVVLLGFKTLRSLVVASSTHSLYQNLANPGFRDKLWEHTLAAALASRTIAETIRHPYLEEAFLSGLMHDIGKLVLSQKIPDKYDNIVTRVEATQGKFIDVEEESLGFNHTDVGLLLLHKWAFPQILCDAVFEHHQPADTDDKPRPLAFVVNLANLMAKNISVGFDDFRFPDLSLHPSAITLGLDTATIERAHDRLKEMFESEKELYQSAVKGASLT